MNMFEETKVTWVFVMKFWSELALFKERVTSYSERQEDIAEVSTWKTTTEN